MSPWHWNMYNFSVVPACHLSNRLINKMENRSCITLTPLRVTPGSGTFCIIPRASLSELMEPLTAVAAFTHAFLIGFQLQFAPLTVFHSQPFSSFLPPSGVPCCAWSQIFLQSASSLYQNCLFWSLAPVLISLFGLPAPWILVSFFHPPVCSSRLWLLQLLCPSYFTWDRLMYFSVLWAQAEHEASLKRESC